MNFYTYIGLTPEEFNERYVNTGLVKVNTHHEFPLNIYNYSRKCVQEQIWDSVTSKCRGIIAHSTTGEVIARPFEKFHNAGSEQVSALDMLMVGEPVVWEKMDGFMCTLYRWEGKSYIASKGSFHSTHAKWATAWFNKSFPKDKGVPQWPQGWTPVFEGIMPDLRIVVNYGTRCQLILLAFINNETGEEMGPEILQEWADELNLDTPKLFDMTLEQARRRTLQVRPDPVCIDEGFVLTWYRPGTTPFRLKMKFIEYLRLHRLVTNVSPKHIWEVLSHGSVELNEYLNYSTPWFKKFVEKWIRALKGEYQRLELEGINRFFIEKQAIDSEYYLAMADVKALYIDISGLRKKYALAFTKPENKEFAGIMFALLDKKDVRPIIWKQVKPMTKDKTPLVNGFAL